MRNLFLLGIFILAGSAVFSQPTINAALPVKAGTVLDFDVNYNGQLIPLTMKIFLPENGGLGFDFDAGDVYGKFFNSKEGLEKALSIDWNIPTAGEERKVATDQTIGIFPRSFFKEIKQNKKASFDGQNWNLKDTAKAAEFLLENKSKLDVIYIQNDDASTKFWLLNNEDYPLIVKVEGNKKGLDLVLKSIR